VADESDLAETVVEAFAAAGAQPGHRALHAKGTLCAATFTPTADAARICRAAHFAGPPLRAHVRFSNGGSNPTGADDAPREGRGMAVKIYLPDQTTTDIVAVTLPAFFVRTPEDFLEFVHARRPDPATGEPDAERIGAFVNAHPESLTALGAVLSTPPPASYLRCDYNALHTFIFTAPDGTTRAVRYHLTPADGAEAADPARMHANYLRDGLTEPFSAVFMLTVSIAQPDDPLDDPTAVWPDDRQRVELGRIDITGLANDREQNGDILVFDPTRVTDGIGLSNDPILHFRHDVYAASVRRRA